MKELRGLFVDAWVLTFTRAGDVQDLNLMRCNPCTDGQWTRRLAEVEDEARLAELSSDLHRLGGAAGKLASMQHQRPVRIPDVPLGPLSILGGGGLGERIAGVSHPVFGLPIFGAPPPAGKTEGERNIQRGPIHSGLAT